MNPENEPHIVIEGLKKGTDTLKDERVRGETVNQSSYSDNSNVPVDRGWAWMILLGSMIQMTLVVGLQKASGIIFVAFQQRFNSTSSMTSLLSTVQNAAYSLSGYSLPILTHQSFSMVQIERSCRRQLQAPVIMTVGLKLTSFRLLLFLGSVITTVSYVISAYASCIQTLLFSYGILQGIGMAFMVPPSVSILGIYFLERRGFANSVAVSGASIGGFIMAPLITYLFQKFGYQGCLLLIGGILLNCCITGALFRPKSFYESRRRETFNSRTLLPLFKENNIHSAVSPKHMETLLTRFKFRSGQKMTKAENECLFTSLPELTNQQPPIRPRTFTNTSHMKNLLSIDGYNKGKIYKSMDFFRCSAFDMNADPNISTDNKNIEKVNKIVELFGLLIASFDFKLFKNPLFDILLITAFLVCPSSLLAAIFLAPFANDIDIDADGIATIVTVFSGVDLISRIVMGLISDKGWLRRSTMIGLAAIIDGVAAQFLSMFSTFNSLMIYTVILGLFSGAYFALFPVVVVDYLTLERLNSVIGFVALFNGAGISFTFYFMGYIRDVTGSYIASYHVIGGMCLVGGLLLILLPVCQKYQVEIEEKRHTLNKPNGN